MFFLNVQPVALALDATDDGGRDPEDDEANKTAQKAGQVSVKLNTRFSKVTWIQFN